MQHIMKPRKLRQTSFICNPSPRPRIAGSLLHFEKSRDQARGQARETNPINSRINTLPVSQLFIEFRCEWEQAFTDSLLNILKNTTIWTCICSLCPSLCRSVWRGRAFRTRCLWLLWILRLWRLYVLISMRWCSSLWSRLMSGWSCGWWFVAAITTGKWNSVGWWLKLGNDKKVELGKAAICIPMLKIPSHL